MRPIAWLWRTPLWCFQLSKWHVTRPNQGLSSLAPGGSKMRDPGNEVVKIPSKCRKPLSDNKNKNTLKIKHTRTTFRLKEHVYRISSNISWGWLYLFSHQKGAIIRGKAIIQGRQLFQIFLTGGHALNILFYYTIKSKNLSDKYKLNI